MLQDGPAFAYICGVVLSIFLALARKRGLKPLDFMEYGCKSALSFRSLLFGVRFEEDGFIEVGYNFEREAGRSHPLMG